MSAISVLRRRAPHLLSQNVRLSLPSVAASRAFCAAPPTVRTTHILLYNYVDDVEEARKPFRAAHLTAARESAQRGELLLGGALAAPVDGGVLLFSTGDAAETFAERDPYVVNGIVTSWTIREWSVVAGSLELPPVPPFQASYEWKRVESEQVCPPGLEIEDLLARVPGQSLLIAAAAPADPFRTPPMTAVQV